MRTRKNGSDFSFRKLVAVAAGVLAINVSVYSQIFTGSVNLIGSATLNAPLGSATGFSDFTGFVYGGQTGDFAGVPNLTSVDFTPFTFSPAPSGSFMFWTFTANSIDYSFDITSISPSSFQNSNFLNLQGAGMINATGFDATPATWTITDTAAGSPTMNVIFGANVNAVPEPSAIAFGVLALGLCAGLGFRRRLAMAGFGKAR